MSEFQSYEWQTIDRLLTPEEQERVNRLSSHIEVGPSKAVVTYDWGDFKHDPKEVLLKYFDAFFYYANWGTLQLMFRFPKGILDQNAVNQYCDGEMIAFETHGEYQVLSINFNPEEGGGDWVDAELSDFIQLREDLLQGDYRLLYLAWLKAADYAAYDYAYENEGEGDEIDQGDDENEAEEESSETVLEPPVPAGLKKLSPALKAFVSTYDIDPSLIEAAAETSADLADPIAVNYRDLVSRLSRTEVDDFLVRLAQGDGSVKVSLRKRLSELLPKEKVKPAAARSFQQLLARAEELEKAEAERKAQEARRKHTAEMKALAQKEPQVWRQVDDLLENGQKTASVYDQATALLEKLKQLADFQDTRDTFLSHVRGLADKYGSRSSLMQRWKTRGWL